MARITIGSVQSRFRDRRTPTISVAILNANRQVLATIDDVTPDPGAEVTVGGSDVLLALGLTESDLSSSSFDLVMANKSTPLLSIGQLDVALRYGSRIATVTVVICHEITGMLISWIDCIALDILHEQYPQPIYRSQPHVSQLTVDHRAPTATPPICDFLRGVYIPNDPSEEQCAEIKSAIANISPMCSINRKSYAVWRAQRWSFS
ncbi:hypothetical protein DAPPUDRAFT_266504 [Daphnia pulex]|uniref:Uncharacterized protein n=1 Tax=Daphnia pulex TaxID=6669 RepID=E9HV44_DAPPU|nr:hypothetical protein DAPPUDRAFT_266504 [Daphnia pulex]|eukprot:EFX64380.1 hypothetical protein DAPPUDRAFT_266504 [Daphnia pulex]